MAVQDQASRTTSPRPEPRPLEEVVFESIEMFGAERDEISLDSRLQDLQIDSLDVVELGQIIEEEYGVRLVLEKFRGVETVGDALEVIRSQLS